jgi:Fe-S-cluster containining protein
MKVYKSSGTMSFCLDCPAKTNCCTRVAHGTEIENPFLFNDEAENIKRRIGGLLSDFSEKFVTNGGVEYLAIKSRAPGCTFFQSGRCTIYDIRPLDCRLFPFDIRRTQSGALMWIVYTDLCPVEFDWRDHFEDAKKLLFSRTLSLIDLETYIDSNIDGMMNRKFIEIEPFQ